MPHFLDSKIRRLALEGTVVAVATNPEHHLSKIERGEIVLASEIELE